MKTVTFYSYKGGAGRSLALANAARYLARLKYKVVALDFDLEAPGLHYKFASTSDAKPLPVSAGVVDYIYNFVVEGRIEDSVRSFAYNVSVPGVDKPLVHLIPAGKAPSKEYWSKLARINWHDLFYSKDAKGVQVFLELKNRILDEFAPDFLLIDSRTGITEMGGVATTLLADMVICLVLPTMENLEGARAVLRSLNHSVRESGRDRLELMVALSRLPQMKESDSEEKFIRAIRSTLNEEAEDLKDTLSCSEIYVLHSEASLEIKEVLRVGSGISPDDSILLRDYLRLFASVVPKELIQSKIGVLIERAKQRIWEEPEAALKEVEELAESFGHPELYRALLSFYEVRNVPVSLAIKRAQRLWELTGNSNDPLLWKIVQKFADTSLVGARAARGGNWSDSFQFIEAVWRSAGDRDPQVAMKLSNAYSMMDWDSHAADLLLETIKALGPDPALVSRCIRMLDFASRGTEADLLIQDLKQRLSSDPTFVQAWAKHALRAKSAEALSEISQPVYVDLLLQVDTPTVARIYSRLGSVAESNMLADKYAREAVFSEPHDLAKIREAGMLYYELGRSEEFEALAEGRVPQRILNEIRERFEFSS